MSVYSIKSIKTSTPRPKNMMGLDRARWLIVIETRDGKKAYDPPPHTPEMQKMNKQFSLLHGASSLANMAAFLMTCWYGAILAERLS